MSSSKSTLKLFASGTLPHHIERYLLSFLRFEELGAVLATSHDFQKVAEAFFTISTKISVQSSVYSDLVPYMNIAACAMIALSRNLASLSVDTNQGADATTAQFASEESGYVHSLVEYTAMLCDDLCSPAI